MPEAPELTNQQLSNLVMMMQVRISEELNKINDRLAALEYRVAMLEAKAKSAKD